MANYGFIPRALAPLAKQRLLKNIAVFDIETTSWPDDCGSLTETEKQSWNNRRIEPFLVMFTDGKRRLFWEDPDCMKDFLKDHLTHKNRQWVTFAHNGGKFDFLALYETLIRDPGLSKRFHAVPFLAHGRIIALKIKDADKHVWHFRDSYSLLLASLNNLCKAFKPAHMKLSRPVVPYAEAVESWREYGMNDCLALYEILNMFNDTIRDVGGAVGYTIASTAMLTFRKKFLKQELPNYFAFNTIFRNAYYGGRVEIIRMHAPDRGTPYYYYDVNSEYPAVMYENCFPVSKPRSVRYKDVFDCCGRCGIMEASIISPNKLDIPLLPYREPSSKKLLFPLGRWVGWYDFSLIEKALSLGYRIKPLRCYEFDDAPLFREYVSTFYKLKSESEGALRETMKRLLNSLYGKFGEHHEREELITDPDEDITGSFPYDDVFGYSIRKYVRYSAYHLPAIAARITALAQLKLYSYIEKAVAAGGRIYYMDTDSLVTDVRLPTDTDLGGLKMEHEIKKAVFLAPKTYCLSLYDDEKEKIVMKGFSSAFHDHITYKDFEEALFTGNLYKFREENIEPASLKTVHIRHLDGFVTVLQKKSLNTFYDKRLINPDYSTEPLTIPLPIPEKKLVYEPLRISHLKPGVKREAYNRSHPLDMNERRLLERLQKVCDHDKVYLLRCIRLAAETDFDLESEIDWRHCSDPYEEIQRKIHPSWDYDRYF